MPDLFATQLREADYEGVAFPVSRFTVDSDHDATEHVAYRRRGADIEPLGRKADRGTLTIPLYNDTALIEQYGTIVPDLHDALVSVFAGAPIGSLNHPTLGSMRVKIGPWRYDGDAQRRRNGWEMEVHWIEHNAEASALALLDTTQAAGSDPLTSLQATAAAADAQMAIDDPLLNTPWTPLSTVFAIALTALDTPTPSVALIQMQCDSMLTATTADLVLFTTAGTYQSTDLLEQVRDQVIALQAQLLASTGARAYVLPVTMALWEAAQVLGVDLATLSAANSINDPLFVPAGTTLYAPKA